MDIPLDTFDKACVGRTMPSALNRFLQWPKRGRNVLGAFSRKSVPSSTHFVLQTLQVTGGRLADGTGWRFSNPRALPTYLRSAAARQGNPQPAKVERRSAGIDNLCADLMFGLPGQTLDDWRCSLDALVALAPEHITAYALTVERGTPFLHAFDTRFRPATAATYTELVSAGPDAFSVPQPDDIWRNTGPFGDRMSLVWPANWVHRIEVGIVIQLNQVVTTGNRFHRLHARIIRHVTGLF